MSSHLSLWGYVSPESIIPLASALSAVVGGLLLFGQRLQAGLARFWPRRNRRGDPAERDGAEA